MSNKSTSTSMISNENESSYDLILVKKVFAFCMSRDEEDDFDFKQSTDDSYYAILESLEESWDDEIKLAQEQRFADYLKTNAENLKECEMAIQNMKEIEPKSKVDEWQVYGGFNDYQYMEIFGKFDSLMKEYVKGSGDYAN